MATPLTRAEWLDECAKLAKTYEEAMTDEAKALVERLRGNRPIPTLPHEAADLIETQAREIERLRGALGFAMRTLEAEGFSDDGPTLNRIRAALAGDSHV